MISPVQHAAIIVDVRSDAEEEMTQITIEVPERFLGERDRASFARQVKLYAALMMFESGELSSGAAAELAGMDWLSFARECSRRKIPVINYSAEELAAELELLRKLA